MQQLERVRIAHDDIAGIRLIFVGATIAVRRCFRFQTLKAQMMSMLSRSILAGTALAVMLAGCQQSDAPATTSSGTPPQPVNNAMPVPQGPNAASTVPDAATAFAAQDRIDKTRATQDTNALQHKPAPQDRMTKEEESKAMPLPGQANDHSTTALDKKKGG